MVMGSFIQLVFLYALLCFGVWFTISYFKRKDEKVKKTITNRVQVFDKEDAYALQMEINDYLRGEKNLHDDVRINSVQITFKENKCYGIISYTITD